MTSSRQNDKLLRDASAFCNEIKRKCHPLEHFNQYLKTGYYPFYFEDKATYNYRVENIGIQRLTTLKYLKNLEEAKIIRRRLQT